MNADQAIAYGTEEWWEYLRGNIGISEIIGRLADLELTTTDRLVMEARAKNAPLLVVHTSGKGELFLHYLPQPY